MKANESGYTLPMALLALLLAAGMMQHAHERAVHFIKIRGIESVGRKQYAGVLASTPFFSSRGGTCEAVTGSSDAAASPWRACYESLPPLKAFPLVAIPEARPDVERIFSEVRPCPAAPRVITDGSFDSPTARSACSPSHALEGDLVVEDNIFAPSLGWAVLPERKMATVATPGTLTILDGIVVDSDLLVFAGGNVAIGSITSLLGQRRNVTVLSMQGTVDVAAAGTGISLVVVGPKALRAPTTPPLTALPYPPSRLPSMLSLAALHGNGT